MQSATHPALKVFLCHARIDQQVVRSLYTRLTKDGIDAWFDKEKLIPGQAWELEICKAVQEADVVIVCLSKHFNESGYRQKEVKLALETAFKQPSGEIFIIPARLEECDTIKDLEKYQWVDLFEHDGYERLMRALRARAAKISVHLQTKKNWLPGGASPNKRDDPISEKKVYTPPPQPEKKVDTLFQKIEDTKPSKPVEKRKPNTAIIVALIGLAGTLIAALLSSPLIEKWLFTSTSTPTQTISTSNPQNPTNPNISGTLAPEATSTPVQIIPVSETPFVGADGMRMVFIPEGEFLMGSTADKDERPIHKVYLNAYWIDNTEVTNQMYADCVDNGGCNDPYTNTSITKHKDGNYYFRNPEYDNYPVIYVSWLDAKAYCTWVGRRLPTEAEWEKAARWDDQTKSSRKYPWGEKINCSYGNFAFENRLCEGDTKPVGSYPSSTSYYGVLDMAGNVWEWVFDRYDPEYYSQGLSFTNPTGPLSGDNMVIRGGSFLIGEENGIRSADRSWKPPKYTSHNLGFRCAMNVTQ